jgi:hypothetical protein
VRRNADVLGLRPADFDADWLWQVPDHRNGPPRVLATQTRNVFHSQEYGWTTRAHLFIDFNDDGDLRKIESGVLPYPPACGRPALSAEQVRRLPAIFSEPLVASYISVPSAGPGPRAIQSVDLNIALQMNVAFTELEYRQIYEVDVVDGGHLWEIHVDATTGKIVDKIQQHVIEDAR